MSLITQTALADETNFPTYSKCKDSDGVIKACFALEQTKQLVVAWQERDVLRSKISLMDEQLTLRSQQIELLRNINITQKEIIDKISAENIRLFSMWEIENKKRHEAENESDWFPWMVAAGFAVSTFTLALTN